MGYLMVWVTTETREEADQIAKEVVGKRLAACAQVSGPITSWFWWKGRIENSMEFRLILKTREALFPRLEEAVKRVHAYETPQIVALPMTVMSDDFRQWLDLETQAEAL